MILDTLSYACDGHCCRHICKVPANELLPFHPGREQRAIPHVSKERIAELIKEARVGSQAEKEEHSAAAGRRRLTEHDTNTTSGLRLDVKAEPASGDIIDLSSTAESQQAAESAPVEMRVLLSAAESQQAAEPAPVDTRVLLSAAESHQKGETHNWSEHHPYFAPQYMNHATETLVLG
jgi:hypothetical protein